ncbi:MAG: DNA alkylation repair protein [Mycobacteriaceae bacterium]
MPFADELLSRSTVTELAAILQGAQAGLSVPTLNSINGTLSGTLKQRREAITEALLADLPQDFLVLQSLITKALENNSFTGWMIWPVTEAVAEHAVAFSDKTFEQGLELLATLTPRLTSEFALRSFLIADTSRTLQVVHSWVNHPDEHVRRLASEGTRNRLPWGKQVPQLRHDLHATVSIIDALYRDPSEYVRRSVANHLNDLSHLNSRLAVQVASRWLSAPDKFTMKLVTHALRTLIKQGDQKALALLGFSSAKNLHISGPTLSTKEVSLGESLNFSYCITNTGNQATRLAVDYLVYHRKANGTVTPKVFKLTTKELAPGEQLSGSKTHSFRVITTRTYYPGQHAIALQVNGAISAEAAFTLHTTS